MAYSAAIAASLLLAPHLFFQDYVLVLLPILLLRTRFQPLIAAAFYLLPFGFFLSLQLRWLAAMAVVPLLFLASLLLTTRSHRVDETQPEKVTPHPLTALE